MVHKAVIICRTNILRAIALMAMYVRTKVEQVISWILGKIITWLCRYYEQELGFAI